MIQLINKYTLLAAAALLMGSCAKQKKDLDPVADDEVKVWITNPGKTALLWNTSLLPVTLSDNDPQITVDSSRHFQSIDGFGYTLTGGSALLFSQLGSMDKKALLNELFGQDDTAIGISYLRISIGASDLSEAVFTYNDLPAGQTDPSLQQFNLSRDTLHLIPLLKEILAINPSIRIMGSPWTAPVWMKSNGSSVGGSLLPQYYGVYAQYFVRYIQAMQAEGITIDAVTPQNEPQHGGNNPSMVMSAAQQADFIKNHLGPAFQAAGLQTKIVVWDHNCDNPGFPLAILNDPAAKQYVDGSAFHLYAGDISALSQVHDAHPDKNLYFTEQWTGANGDFGTDLKWHIKNVIIGSMRNWSRVALEWNLAADPNYDPHTPGGCSQCKGALTIDGTTVSRNVSYYIIAHVSKFVPPGSVRIGSNVVTELSNVVFKTPEGNYVAVVLNESTQTKKFTIRCNSRLIKTSLSPGSVGTFVWKD